MSNASFRPPAPATQPARTQASPRTEVHSFKDGLPALTKPKRKGNSMRADFDPNHFIAALEDHGKWVTWRKALACPCSSDTEQPEMNCESCNGSGWLYIDPIFIQAHMLSFDKTVRSFEKIGMWLEGSTSVTTLPEHRLGYRDSLELRDLVMSHAEQFTKGSRRGYRALLPPNHDCVRYRIVDVEHMQVLVSQNGRKVPVALEAGTHYELTDKGWIRWLGAGDALVTPDTIVSLRYLFRPVYVVESHPHVVRDDLNKQKSPDLSAIALPVQAVARLDYLVFQQAAPSTGSF